MADDATTMSWEATCAECALNVMQSFEGLQRAGWVCRHNEKEDIAEWFCPGCVYGLKRPAAPPAGA